MSFCLNLTTDLLNLSQSAAPKRRVRALRFRLSTFDASSSYFQGLKAVLDLQDEFALDTCSPSRCLAL